MIAYDFNFQINLQPKVHQWTLSIFGFADQYIAEQMHLHWREDSSAGSEHQLGGSYFSAELHLVHYDFRFISVKDALLNGPKGAVVVIAKFFQVSAINIKFSNFIKFMQTII